MPEYDDSNRGSLYKNLAKENERQPDYKGSINVAGTEYWLSAWIKVAGEGSRIAGQKFMSLSVTPKDAPPQEKPKAQTPMETIVGMDSDIPF